MNAYQDVFRLVVIFFILGVSIGAFHLSGLQKRLSDILSLAHWRKKNSGGPEIQPFSDNGGHSEYPV